MARKETEKEDLLAEGVNLPQRGRITAQNDRQWVAGWRNEQSLSLFVDQDPVFHFNASGDIRRVYIDGCKLTARDRELFKLIRVPKEHGRVSLVHQPLTDQEADQVQLSLKRCLHELKEALNDHDGHLPGGKNVETIGIEAVPFCQRLEEWINTRSFPVQIAELPNVD